MKSKTRTLKALFWDAREYVVPLYQRLYVWDKDGQWAPLWEDLTSIAKTLAQDGAQDAPHFFGAIVLKRSPEITDDKVTEFRVIDGQQRLTTMQLLIAAAADEMESRSTRHAAAVETLRKLITYSTIEGHERYKMRHGGQNYSNFEDVMAARGDRKRIGQLGGDMADCYLYFRDATANWLDAPDSKTRAKALTTTILEKLQAIAIYLDAAEPEHLVFETLNARGVSLTEWDKIRNYLFYRVSKGQDKFFTDYLEDFDDGWWRTHSGSGQDRRPRTDRFVDYWLESRNGKSVAASRVFRVFRGGAEKRDPKRLISGIESLVDDAEYYRKFEGWDDNSIGVEGIFHERRRLMGIGAFWPFILWLRRERLEDAQFGLVLSAIESWFVRRWLVGHQARNYPDRALDLLRQARASKNSKKGDKGDIAVARLVIDHLATSERAGRRWPQDHEVSTAVEEGWFTDGRRRRLVLEAIEQHITPERAERTQLKHGQLQIEHIMPVGWKPRSWPLGKDTREERNRLIQTLGNLTLVHERLNPSMSNKDWETKRAAILKTSNLFLNKDILRGAEDGWNEKMIRRRGKWMGKMVCEIWPHAEVLEQRL